MDVKAYLLALVLATAVVTSAGADVENGDFSAGMPPWKAAWHVDVASGEAVMSDALATHAFLFQSATAPGGPLVVSFDFLNELSADVPAGTFLDSFFASVYEVDDPADFVLEHDRFDAAHALMDLDSGGAFNVMGVVSASTKGGAWQHFEGTISPSHGLVVIVFELHSLNDTAGDSVVRIDNVRLGVIQQ